MSPLSLVLVLAGTASAFAWLASLVTKDYSWVDRGWSIVPVGYLWVFAGAAHLRNPRLDLMAGLVTLWGVRLTYNFARKGGYRGVEDYRWAILRQRMSRRKFQLFNFFFIVLYQNFLLVLITLPALSVYEHTSRPFDAMDVALGVLFIVLLLYETIADQQQWNFQTRKSQELAAGVTPAVRFLQSGLFRYSRHPNYFFEIAQWWVVFAFAVVASGSLWQSTVLGAVLLTLLFVGSTRFTEEITLSRYPEYADYQRRTPPVIPWFVDRDAAPSVALLSE
ncbi:MAG TPA: DUF1295 domain-containing protein [Acidimicrobiales bacterium]|nr:DUF1295 domain-containing protein [Acidimicrobiales bacterium]